jgi:hypothetical protein
MRTDPPQIMHYWIAAAACGAVASWALLRFLVSLRRDRLLADTPRVRIRSAAQGYVKLFGRARPAEDSPLVAPLSSRPCVWWRYKIEQRIRNEKGESRWETIDSGASVSLFALAETDAACLVGPVNAEITPTVHDVWYGARPHPSGPPTLESNRLDSGDFRYTEWLLRVGDQLSVIGELRSKSELGDTGAATSALLGQWKRDQKTLLARFDRNHDGRIDAAEWDGARQAAAEESRRQSLRTPITRMTVISQPVGGEPFLIAPLDDAHLIRREKLHAALYFCLGLLCVLLCAWSIEHARAIAAAIM